MLKHKLIYISVALMGVMMILCGNVVAQDSLSVAPASNLRFDPSGNLVYPFEDEGAFDYPDNIDNGPLYLSSPSNIERSVEYDPVGKQYILYEKVGNVNYRLPKSMSLQEYVEYDFDQSVKNYWRTFREVEQAESESGSLIPQFKINSEAFTNIFGSNTIDIRPQGYVEVAFGVQSSFIDDPARAERLKRTTTFDFDQQINMSVTGKIGDKVDMQVNFNTEATFDYENKININYAGKEDEILKKIEAGNVSLPLNGTLIQGATNLFGVKTVMQFGHLNLTTILSQYKGETSTVETEGGAQKTTVEVRASDYDANRHFFLSKYFRDNYDKSLATSPVIVSKVAINKVEVWVTNKTQDYSSARDIVAFADLGEHGTHIFNTVPEFSDNTSQPYPLSETPNNGANGLYEQLITMYSEIRTSTNITKTLLPLESSDFKNGQDWEKIDQARKLSASEYTVNEKLGYISLKSALNSDEVLAVAFNYTVGDTTLQVGEFSSDGIDAPQTLILKMLKGTNLSPGQPTWDLMMKNIYSLNAYDITSEEFDIYVSYYNDSTNTYINYLPEGKVSEQTLLRVLNLDNANSQLDYVSNGDGMFDYIEGYTVLSDNGKIIFPVLEPFGSYLRNKIGDDAIADKYVFQSIYDSSKTQAELNLDANKFYIMGSFKGSSSSEISLNSFNLSEGSVVVTAGGIVLTENVDYTVDYSLGRVKIINSALIEAGTPIQVSTESQELFSTKRTTLVGTYADYEFSDKFRMGGTLLYMNEKPVTNKVDYGEDPVSNLMLGLDFSYRDQSQFLTDAVNYLPFTDTDVKSSFSIEGEVAKLIPGSSKFTGNAVFIDDFENLETEYSLSSYNGWYLASTPQLFSEASLLDDLRYGYNRAKFSWYYIDPLFNSLNGSTLPSHLKGDRDALSNHYTRAVYVNEVYPGKQLSTTSSSLLYILNLAYFPEIRGPYNYDAVRVASDGKLLNPEDRWGGVMRSLQTTNFETANIGYIEFWMMDPFIYDEGTHRGGDLYFNLGNISEDILRDGRKAFENGLPTSDVIEDVDTTSWGRVSTKQLLTQAFDNSDGSREYQDVGLDGLNDVDERSFFSEFLDQMRNVLSSEAYNKIEADPSSDDYQYFRGSQLDAVEASIIDRYKNINNFENSSPTIALSTETYSTSVNDLPNIEDINGDNTLSESENYYQYRVSIRPEDMQVGQNYIVDKASRSVTLLNNTTETIDWYRFKIPIDEYQEKIGNINDFTSVRFMRMFMTNFADSVILRFASLGLTRSDWRIATQSFAEAGAMESSATEFTMSTVNIEEDENKNPINYVLPPDVTREYDVSSSSSVLMNEQSMLLKVLNLEAGDARAVYKTAGVDFRQYKKLKMEVHAEAIDGHPIEDNEVTLFIRLGNNSSNYYEYEIPLSMTPVPSTRYNTNSESDQYLVWPDANRLNIDLDIFPALKLARNEAVNRAGSTVKTSDVYSVPDNSWQDGKNTIKIVGNPSLAEVEVVYIGIRNPMSTGTEAKSVEVWVNELRLADYDQKGGWASSTRMSLRLADVGSLSMAGTTQSVGWGSISQSATERSLDDRYQFDMSANLQIGKLLPEKIGLQMPMYYNISRSVATPEYSPLNTDIKMKTALSLIDDPEEREAYKASAQDVSIRKSLTFNNISIAPERKNTERKPKIYDIENFSVSYTQSEQLEHDIDIEKYLQRSRKGTFNYTYSATAKSMEPFKNIKLLNNQITRFIKDFNLNFVPTSLAFRTDLSRTYSERQARNNTGSDVSMPLTVSKDLLWNRYFDFRYSPARSLTIDFTNQNVARIDELEGAMDPYSDTYDEMMAEIYRNLRNLGRPVDYQHTMNIRYTPPINKLPLLSWVTGDLSYQGRYDWDAGTYLGEEDTLMLGNTANNGMTFSASANANLLTLYNKVPYLKAINSKYQSTSRSSRSRSRRQEQQKAAETKPKNEKARIKDVEYSEKKVSIKRDIPKSIFHKLGTQSVDIVVLSQKGDTIKGDFVVVNENRVTFTADTALSNLTVLIKGKKELGDSFLKKATEMSTRILMSVRSVRATYNQTGSTVVPGFLPSPYLFGGRNYTPNENMFGSKPSMVAPTIPFLMGWQNEDFGIKAAKRGWITTSEELNEQYAFQSKETYTFNIQAEPIPNLRIDFTGTRSEARNASSYITYDNASDDFYIANRKETGNFSMSIFTLKTAFRSSERLKGKGVQSSELFNDFLANRAVILSRLNNARGYVEGQGYVSNRNYDSKYEVNGYSETSTDVLIPAFLAAYTGTDPSKASLSPFPSLKFIRPNWRLTYNCNPSSISWMKDYVYSLNISHAYNATYSVNSFETNLSYDESNPSGFSWVRNQLDDMFTPQYDITTVNIQETFSPLINVSVGFVNDLSVNFEIKKQRNFSLSFSNNQLTETLKNEFSIGTGYRFTGLDMILKTKRKTEDVSNDINLKLDLSSGNYKSTYRKIVEGDDQLFGGLKTLSLDFSADYMLSDRFTVQLYYRYTLSRPHLSSSYETRNTDFGLSFNFTIM